MNYSDLTRTYKYIMGNFVLMMTLLLIGHSHAWSQGGLPQCSTCLSEIEEVDARISCCDGHQTDRDCLNREILSAEDILRVESAGLRCNGLDAEGKRCQLIHGFDEILKTLDEDQKSDLKNRLDQAKIPTDKKFFDLQVSKLTMGIEDAFTHCCPEEGCGSYLDGIEGCNAAKCSNPDCQKMFCFLCLKPQSDWQTAHAHVREHSGDFWERRPGYVDRYHWILAREQLSHLFKGKIDPVVRKEVLKAKEELLKEKNMLPFPAGQMTRNWLQIVKINKDILKEKRIEILQNEYIFRLRKSDTSNAKLIEAEISSYGGVALKSLDTKDARRINPPVVNRQGENGRVVANEIGEHPQLIPVAPDDPRVTPAFAALGEMYEIPGLGILSGVFAERMTFEAANGRPAENGLLGFRRRAAELGFCERHGGRMLSREDWELVARSMGKGTPAGYQRDTIPGMSDKWFWSSSVHPGNGSYAYGFYGYNGNVGDGSRNGKGAVRCVMPVE